MDNKSCVEHFNTNLKSFVNNIIECFPEYQETLSDYYNNLLESESSTEDKYVKRFILKTTEYNSLISKRNDDLFNNDIYLLKNINFKELWSKDISDNSRDKIWEHIQHLYFLGKTLCGKISNIDNLVKQVNDETGDASEKSEDQEILDMLKNLKTKDKPLGDIPQNFFTDGLIGNLAKELAEDEDMKKMSLDLENNGSDGDILGSLMGGDNPMKFMNLLQTVSKKIQSKVSDGGLDESKLVDEAQSLMSSLKDTSPLMDNIMKMTKNMNMNQKQNSSQNSNQTRDRLRRKLEDRQNKDI